MEMITPDNTTYKVCCEVKDYLQKNSDIKTVVVASTTGKTGLYFAEMLKDIDVKLVIVRHNTGFSKDNFQEMPKDIYDALLKSGAEVVTSLHLFRAVGKAIANKYGCASYEFVIADTLRMFGEGTKVAVEIAVMAADAGVIAAGKDIISIAGTGHGADTALVISPVNARELFNLRVKEVIYLGP